MDPRGEFWCLFWVLLSSCVILSFQMVYATVIGGLEWGLHVVIFGVSLFDATAMGP